MPVPVIPHLDSDAQIAPLNRRAIQDAGVFAVLLVGGPGCGKTALIESAARLLPDVCLAAIAADNATPRDAERLAACCGQVVQVKAGHEGYVRAADVHAALEQIDLSDVDVLVIENVGGLVWPVSGMDVGQDATVAAFSVAGGDDKAAKHPHVVHDAGLILLNKTDLLAHVDFDLGAFRADVLRLRPDVDLLELSVRDGRGADRWARWIDRHVPVHKHRKPATLADDRPLGAEWFFG